jgi:tetratricopeptide (TPR) repeat protein
MPNSGVKAQILRDTTMYGLIKRGIDYIYNTQFDEANEIYLKIKHAYPDHPVLFLFRGLLTYWENYPLLPSSPVRQSFENDMHTSIKLCEKRICKNDEAEYLMANFGARGMLLLFYADNGISMEVISLAPSTYQCVRRSFDFVGSYPDLYFITGLYKYYREAYPEAHPIYKSIAFLFPKGNCEEGLKELQLATKHAIFLKAEAYSFLTGIYISFENNFYQAMNYSKALHELYPRNVQYLAVYIKNLLLTKHYDEAEKIINTARDTHQNKYFQAQLSILQGILYEKKDRDLQRAKTYYLNGIRDTAPYGVFAGEFNAYAYFGLSRISAANNDNRMKKVYRKEAMDQSNYENVNFDD